MTSPLWLRRCRRDAFGLVGRLCLHGLTFCLTMIGAAALLLLMAGVIG